MWRVRAGPCVNFSFGSHPQTWKTCILFTSIINKKWENEIILHKWNNLLAIISGFHARSWWQKTTLNRIEGRIFFKADNSSEFEGRERLYPSDVLQDLGSALFPQNRKWSIKRVECQGLQVFSSDQWSWEQRNGYYWEITLTESDKSTSHTYSSFTMTSQKCLITYTHFICWSMYSFFWQAHRFWIFKMKFKFVIYNVGQKYIISFSLLWSCFPIQISRNSLIEMFNWSKKKFWMIQI